MPRKRNRKNKDRILSVPSLDNKLRYGTTDPQQLPTPGPTPTVKPLPIRQEKGVGVPPDGPRFHEEEDEARSSDDEGQTYGPWVEEGNPCGFLDSEDEVVIEG